jgi:hypothetical protein
MTSAKTSAESSFFDVCSMLYKSSLLSLLLQRVKKTSEVCHWIVSVNEERRDDHGFQTLLNAAID